MKTNLRIAIIIYTAAILMTYLCTIDNSVGFDNDASAIASYTDYGMYVVRTHQDHLLETVMNKAWFDLFRFFGFQGSAIMPLRFLSCIFGALGVVGFFILLRIIFGLNRVAFFGSAGLAFSFFYWVFSTDIEGHLFPQAVFIYCLILLFRLDGNKAGAKIRLLAILHSICNFLSTIYIFFLPAIVVGILTCGDSFKNRRRLLLSYLKLMFFFWLLPNLAVAVYFYFYGAEGWLKFSPDLFRHLFNWFKDEVELQPFRLVNLPVYYTHVINYTYNLPRALAGAVISFYVFFAFLFIKNIKNIVNNYRRVLLVVVALIVPYQLILLVYEPYNLERYSHFLIGFWLILAILMKPCLVNKKIWLRVLPFLFVLFTFYLNLTFYIYPRHIVVLGPIRQGWIDNLNKQVEELYKKGQYQDALGPLREIGRILVRTFGYNDPHVVKYVDRLAGLYIKIGRSDKAAELKCSYKRWVDESLSPKRFYFQ